MKELEFYIPLSRNDGARISPRKLTALKRELADAFGGVTYFPQQNEGLWKVGRVTFRDQIVIYRVITDDSKRARRIISRLKAAIKKDWQQDDVLIIQRSIRAI